MSCKSVLIVEDDADFRSTLQKLLERVMPGMNGCEFLDQLKKDQADSARKMPSGFMKKTVQIDALLDEVRQHCGSP